MNPSFDYELKKRFENSLLELRILVETLLFEDGRGHHNAAKAPDPLGFGYSEPWGQSITTRYHWKDRLHCAAFYKDAKMASFVGWVAPSAPCLDSAHAAMRHAKMMKRQTETMKNCLDFLNKSFVLNPNERLAITIKEMTRLGYYTLNGLLDCDGATMDTFIPYQIGKGLHALARKEKRQSDLVEM